MERGELARALRKYTVGPAEILASAATGTVAAPIAGWSGILATTQPDGPTGGDVASKLQERLTYAPRSELTAELLGDIGDAVPDWIKEAAAKYSEVSGAVGEESPVAGAAMDTLPAAVGMLVPYASRLKSVAASVPDSALSRQAGILRGLSDEEALTNLGVAKLKEGADPYEVWGEYGVGEMPGIPGKYFDEIDDSAASVSREGMSYDYFEPARLPNYLKHQELYQRAPVMKFATQVPTREGEGYWIPEKMEMGVNPALGSPNDLKTALHEAQHGVAGLTKLPQGTMPSQDFYFFDNVIGETNKQKAKILKEMGIDESIANDVYRDPNSIFAETVDINSPQWEEIKGINDYLRLAYEARANEYKKYYDNYGEALARMTEARRNMDKTDRSISYPFDEETFQRQTGSKLSDVLRNYRGE